MYFTISPKARRKKTELKGRLHMKEERERRWNAKKQPMKNPEAHFWIQCIRGNERKYWINHIFRKKSPMLWWSKAEEVKWQWKVYLIIVRIQELSPCLHIYSFSFVDSPPTSEAIRKAEKYCSLFSSYRPANEQGKQASGKIYVLSFNSNPVEKDSSFCSKHFTKLKLSYRHGSLKQKCSCVLIPLHERRGVAYYIGSQRCSGGGRVEYIMER